MRLNKPAKKLEIPIFDDQINKCYIVFWISLFLGNVYFIAIFNMRAEQAFVTTIGIICEISACCILTASLLFILVDCQFSAKLIDHMSLLQDKNELTLDICNHVRVEIKERVRYTLIVNYLLLGVALANVITFVVVMLFANAKATRAFLDSTLYLKEFPFLAIVFFNGAMVNEKADKLTRKISQHKSSNALEDYNRLALFVNLTGEKLSFPFVGCRMSHRDITRQLLAWLAGLFCAIIKALLSLSPHVEKV